MKHLPFVGDRAASTLLEYASRLADSGHADTVELNALGPDGHSVTAMFLLDQGAALVAETADDFAFDEPDNELAVARMERAMRDLVPTPISRMTSSEIESLARTFEGSDDADG